MSEERRSVPTVAVVGMGVRVAGCDGVDAFWELLRTGTCALREGANGEPARARLDRVDLFDHAFFGLSAEQALVLDPQQRIGLEVAWHAVEDAGGPATFVGGRLGIYASVGYPAYRDTALALAERMGLERALRNGCKEDFFASRLAVALDARGPVCLQGTACSSSLFAFASAVRDIRAGACDAAVVCAASIGLGRATGAPSELHARDGRCRPYDARGSGLVGGDGVVAVVLRRVDAADTDAYARVLGVGVTNDGSRRMSFASPSPRGQAEAGIAALEDAGIDAGTISLIEGHGSGTRLGDAVELEALGSSYGNARRAGPVSLGSVKGNVGHADVAAGLLGVVKAVLCLRHALLVPTLGFETPTPLVDWSTLPFRVQTEAASWPRTTGVARAGVHSVGMGGTNVHVILERDESHLPIEGSALLGDTAERPTRLAWCVSARSRTALESVTAQVAVALRNVDPGIAGLAVVSRTLRESRGTHRYRRFALAESAAEGSAALERTRGVLDSKGAGGCVFAFGGLGSLPIRDPDSRGPGGNDQEPPQPPLDEQHVHAQVELAREWMDRWFRPDAVVGFSLGEISAFVVADVISLADACTIAQARRELIAELAMRAGALAIHADVARVERLLEGHDGSAHVSCELAKHVTIVAGRAETMNVLARAAESEHIHVRPVPSQRAAHTPLLWRAVERLRAVLRSVDPKPARALLALPAWKRILEVGEVLDRDYLAEQLCTRLLWHATLTQLHRRCGGLRAVVEMNGPPCVSALAAPAGVGAAFLSALPPDGVSRADHEEQTRAELWARDVAVSARSEPPHRVPIRVGPYPFERARLWLEGGRDLRSGASEPAAGPEVEGSFVDRPPGHATSVRPDPASSSSALHASVASVGAVARIFEEELGVSVDPDADFFEAGGRSLTALVVVTRLRQELDMTITIADFMERRSARGIAAQAAAEPASRVARRWPRAVRSASERAELARAVSQELGSIVARLDAELGAAWAAGERRHARENSSVIAALIDEIRLATGAPVFPHELLRCDSLEALGELVSSIATLPAASDAAFYTSAPRAARIAGPARRISAGTRRNRAAVFILSSARSGSTLLRVMLAGHPHLFSPPELHLLSYEDMAQRRAGLSSQHFGSGLSRAWQELSRVPPKVADEEIRRWEDDARPIRDVYRRLQEAAGERLLVDKSPSYARSLETLERVDDEFDGAFVIYLHRHPLAVMESYVRNRLDSIGRPRDASPWRLAEQHWHEANTNIRAFLGLSRDLENQTRPRRPHCRIAFEDLVTRPESVARTICAALGIDYEPRVLGITGADRMRDGPGDPAFSTRSRIDAGLAWNWREHGTGSIAITESTRELARSLGYDP